MKHFVIGSTVVRKENNEQYYVSRRRGDIVELIRKSNGHLWTTKDKYTDRYMPLDEFLSEELPPAPTDVKYNEGATIDTLTVKQSASLRQVYIGFKGHSVATLLDPDDALQLCHDLRRMAMDIKRKEKNG